MVVKRKVPKQKRLPLLGGPYQARGIIASGQRSVNVYPEKNTDPQSPVPITHYQTPGTLLYSVAPDLLDPYPVRCTYRSSIETGYAVVGPYVYFVQSNGAMSLIGIIADRPSQVYMADNGLALVIVDGTDGWAVDMSTNALTQITDPAFYGADFAQFLDTFFVFNRPDTNQFYITLAMASYGMLSNTGVLDGTIAGGAAYTPGTYESVALTGGSGVEAVATIVVDGSGVVTVVNMENGGFNYVVGNVLSAVIPGGAGFTYTVTEMETAFDPLDIAAKSGSADPIIAILVAHNNLWLVGQITTEIWVGTGAADFYFQKVQGAFIENGCYAQYSATSLDTITLFISQSDVGKGIIVKGNGYTLEIISTPAIVELMNSFETYTDAIGFCYQSIQHAFYVLCFPTANRTLCFDLSTNTWHERTWTDLDGVQNRHRANCGMYINGKNIVGDYEFGMLLELNEDTYTDVNPNDLTTPVPIVHTRTFPHLMNEGLQVTYTRFIADMELGLNEPGTTVEITLRMSQDRGNTFGQGMIASSEGGDFLRQLSWTGLGMSRDAVFEVSWSSGFETCLNGAFVDVRPHTA